MAALLPEKAGGAKRQHAATWRQVFGICPCPAAEQMKGLPLAPGFRLLATPGMGTLWGRNGAFSEVSVAQTFLEGEEFRAPFIVAFGSFCGA